MSRWKAALGLAVLVGVAALPAALPNQSKDLGSASVVAKPTKTVLILGASVAEGWDDKGNGGYLIRAFQTLSSKTDVTYQVYNKASAGDGCLEVVKTYPQWLKTYKPQVVVISWGALDDLHAGTPLSTVQAQVAWETRLALRNHAVVFLVTPPITRASYEGKFVQSEPDYVRHEIAGARSVKNANVYVADVFNQMKAYIAAHHQTYVPYMGDGWHPNTAGHILAGRILSNDIQKVFGTKPITFK